MSKSLMFSIALCLVSLRATATPPPPEYVELTNEQMKMLKFDYKIWKKGAFSFIDLRFPAQLSDSLVPHSVHVVSKNLRGEIIQDSTSWAGLKYLSTVNRYNHEQIDLAISVVFSCKDSMACAAREYGIRSVSNFISRNAKPNDLLPE